jgi:hypothetical protein
VSPRPLVVTDALDGAAGADAGACSVVYVVEEPPRSPAAARIPTTTPAPRRAAMKGLR